MMILEVRVTEYSYVCVILDSLSILAPNVLSILAPNAVSHIPVYDAAHRVGQQSLY